MMTIDRTEVRTKALAGDIELSSTDKTEGRSMAPAKDILYSRIDNYRQN
jgi:hypothetical protein